MVLMSGWAVLSQRLINMSGLLLVTNDGEPARALMHLSQQFERKYAVRSVIP